MPQWYYLASGIWILIACITFVILFKKIAPFGRHTQSGFGPLIPNRLGWILMESPALWLMAFLVFIGPGEKTLPVWIMFGLFELHYLHRTLIFPFQIRTKGKKMPLTIVGSAFFFQLVNVSLIGYVLGWQGELYPEYWIGDPRFIFGILLFFIGMYLNIQADYRLIHLRKPGETGYKIPKGGLFEQVTCPNFTGELLEWAGFALLSWNLAALSFFIWSAANLLPRAWAHHRWYLAKFPGYPSKRKIVIPFLW